MRVRENQVEEFIRAYEVGGTPKNKMTTKIRTTLLTAFFFFGLLIGLQAQTQIPKDSVTGAYSYQPAANYNGADAFIVQVRDPSGATVTQRVDITVVAQNDKQRFSFNAVSKSARVC